MPPSHQQPQQMHGQMGAPQVDLSWDPAIVTSGNVADLSGAAGDDQPPHWLASLQNLTDETTNHRLPFVQQFPTYNAGVNFS